MDLDKDLHLNEITEIVILLGANTEVAQASKSFTYEGVSPLCTTKGSQKLSSTAFPDTIAILAC